jgi:hypothetical protein
MVTSVDETEARNQIARKALEIQNVGRCLGNPTGLE